MVDFCYQKHSSPDFNIYMIVITNYLVYITELRILLHTSIWKHCIYFFLYISLSHFNFFRELWPIKQPGMLLISKWRGDDGSDQKTWRVPLFLSTKLPLTYLCNILYDLQSIFSCNLVSKIYNTERNLK